MATLNVPGSPENFAKYLKSRLTKYAPTLTEDRYEGWFIGNFFSIGHVSGHSYSRHQAIRNRMLGYISKTANGSKVTWFRFYGFTDPVSILSVFLVFLIFMLIVRNFGGILKGAPISDAVFYAAAFAAITILYSWASSRFSKEGTTGYHKLLYLLFPDIEEADKKAELAAQLSQEQDF